MGTRFMATKEAPIHQNVKQAIVDGKVESTKLVMRSMRNTERVYDNDAAREVLKLESQYPGDFSKIKHLMAGSVYKKVFHETGDVKQGIWSAGLSMGLIDDIPTCEELVNNIVNEAVAVIQKKLAPAISN